MGDACIEGVGPGHGSVEERTSGTLQGNRCGVAVAHLG